MSKINPNNEEENTSCISRDRDGLDPALPADEEYTFLISSETSETPGTSHDNITKPTPCEQSSRVYDTSHILLSYGEIATGFQNCKRKRSLDDEGQGRYEVEDLTPGFSERKRSLDDKGQGRLRYEVAAHNTTPSCCDCEPGHEDVNERTCLKNQRFNGYNAVRALPVDVPRGVKRKNGGLHRNRPLKRLKTYHVVRPFLLRSKRKHEADQCGQPPTKRLKVSTRDEEAPTCSRLSSRNSFVTLPETERSLPNDTRECPKTSVEEELRKQVRLTWYSEDIHIALPSQDGHAEETSAIARLDADASTYGEGLLKQVGLACYSEDFHTTLLSQDGHTEETSAVPILEEDVGTSGDIKLGLHKTTSSVNDWTANETKASQDGHKEVTSSVARLDADVGTTADTTLGPHEITSSSNDLAEKNSTTEQKSEQLPESSVIKSDSDESSSSSSESSLSSTSESSLSSTSEAILSTTSESSLSSTLESSLSATSESSLSTNSESDFNSSSRSSERSSAEDLSDSDDDKDPSTSRDELPGMCPRACVCRSGARLPPTSIKRRKGFKVEESLHRRLLKARLLKQRPLLLNPCCSSLCCLEWSGQRVNLNDF